MCSLEDAWGSSIAAAGAGAAARFRRPKASNGPTGPLKKTDVPEPTFSRGQLLPAAVCPPPPGSFGGYEGFANETTTTSTTSTTSAVPANRPRSNPDVNTNYDATYRAMVNDYKFFCEKYGICSDVEGFACAPLQTPNIGDAYSEPLKAQLAKALEASLSADSAHPRTIPAPMPMRQVNMTGVSGFHDEELSSYLHSKGLASSFAPAPQAAPVPEETAVPRPAPRHVLKEPESGPRPVIKKPSPRSWFSMELLLFVITGIIIILLMEQLFKIAAHIGMRQSVTMLEPILARLEELKRTVPVAA